ncbi:hypothetical protein EPUS_02878 [Endocarpon pusillum Z07020]|uniref:WD repeat-containing protein 75 second beta-propeller domain-containing protein n=1 Tax=Endocarpon pusillum (strain Z07020 / HMAS-L-300199) TaxID=1263415 RepID=U1GL46_ENDPU|nr:uncharacterized protein EPUS_02878 [Endocarpon pusillum Z07020]ERF72596.1 hypothetical protein EPUS_02878 [Endocarpon pusillum Z07020]
MSNGEISNLKRPVDAAFGSERNEHKSKQSRRKRSKASGPQQDSAQELNSIPTKGHTSPSRNGTLKALQLPNPLQSRSPAENALSATQTRELGGQGPRQHSKKTSRKQKRSLPPEWSISAAEAGRFIDHDPILMQKDRYLILAVRTQVLVYSTQNSRLVRSLRLDEHEKITSYTTCATNENCILVSTYSGLVVKWDWTTGQEIKQWRSSAKLLAISEQSEIQDDTLYPTMLLIHEVTSTTRRVSLATLQDSSVKIITDKVILEENQLTSWIRVLDKRRCLVLYAYNKLFLGQAVRRPEDPASVYTWREIAVPRRITSIDARSHSSSSSTNKKHLAIDIVIGCQDGSILIYDDILFKLINKEKNPREEDIASRRFHWHRNEVLTVKWSLDGNYIISGGHETVMVIWQLDTGQKQFLPHLSAAIQHLTVSDTGSSYALHLADNSVMVLSTSELEPFAYVSSLNLQQPRLYGKKTRRIQAILHHTDPTSLLLAVAADIPSGTASQGKATLLQTYDIGAQQQSHRQALVRNNITALNVDPSGKPVQEPDVTHLKISHDGKWLATVDDWDPPADDLKTLYPAHDDHTPHAKETFLKFWAMNTSTRSWELVTKIECPHSTRSTAPCSILDLEANPQRTEFATILSDGSIYIWTAKSRHRNGLPVKDKSGSPLYTWSHTHTVQLLIPLKKITPTASALCYSLDGSVLAVSSNKSAFVHFVDPLTGNVQHTQHGSHPGLFSYLTFLNHHLITISKDLRVYNTVSGDLLYALAFNSSLSGVHLAANQLDQTFAVVCLLPAIMSKEKEDKAKLKSQIMLFNLKSASPIFRRIVDGTVETILPLPSESGYLIINDEAEIVYLRQPGSSLAKRNDVELPALEDAPKRMDLEEIIGRRSIEGAGPVGHMVSSAEKEDDSAQKMQPIGYTHKTQSSLSDVFNNHATNLPVRELFEQVVAVLRGGSEA